MNANPQPLRSGMVLLYDGNCALCRRASERLVRWAAAGTVERLSFREPGMLSRFPQVDPAACEQAMQLVLDDGRLFSGAHAAFRILATRRWLTPALWLYLVPGVRQLIDALYRLIARNRHRFGRNLCKETACTLRE